VQGRDFRYDGSGASTGPKRGAALLRAVFFGATESVLLCNVVFENNPVENHRFTVISQEGIFKSDELRGKTG
jgi:hypothetical protein